ncbi:hypothetical protein M6B38_223970 [Iris pallida]|uniref:Uncharacterized protein n=1 Tax=Iris pallida TaxID=29817 RepID=A0AAX6DVX5_IRIPA|nr:hypothetical protein M6B38_223970 [Iris pallida]
MAARNDDLFVDTVGSFRKGRLYGVGSLAPLHASVQRFPPSPPPTTAPTDDDVRSQLAHLHEAVSSLREQLAAYFLPPSTTAGPSTAVAGPSTTGVGPSSVGRLSFNPVTPLVPPPTVTTLLDLIPPEQLRQLLDHVFDGLSP